LLAVGREAEFAVQAGTFVFPGANVWIVRPQQLALGTPIGRLSALDDFDIFQELEFETDDTRGSGESASRLLAHLNWSLVSTGIIAASFLAIRSRDSRSNPGGNHRSNSLSSNLEDTVPALNLLNDLPRSR
jgi:hypothetical protein